MCGKEGCKECMSYLFTVYRYSCSHPTDGDWFCHNDQCYETFAKKIENNITPTALNKNKCGVELLRDGFCNTMQKSENTNGFGGKIDSSDSPDDFLFVNANSEFIARLIGS